MHILFVADGDSKYGAQNSLIQLVSALKEIDSSLQISVVLTCDSTNKETFQRVGCDTYEIPYVPFYQAIPYSKWKLPFKYVLRGLQYLCGRIFAVSVLNKRMDISSVDIIHVAPRPM